MMQLFNKKHLKNVLSNEFVLKAEQIKPKHVTPTISLLLINNMSTKILCIEYITRRKRFLAKNQKGYTIIIPTKRTRFLLLKSQDITICNFVLYFYPYMFQPAWVIFRGLNASAWLKLLLITIY
jgi:hypothetical protein